MLYIHHGNGTLFCSSMWKYFQAANCLPSALGVNSKKVFLRTTYLSAVTLKVILYRVNTISLLFRQCVEYKSPNKNPLSAIHHAYIPHFDALL